MLEFEKVSCTDGQTNKQMDNTDPRVASRLKIRAFWGLDIEVAYKSILRPLVVTECLCCLFWSQDVAGVARQAQVSPWVIILVTPSQIDIQE